MKLLFESWRQYLVEAEQADLEKDVVALIRKYNLDKQDIKKLLALKEEEEPALVDADNPSEPRVVSGLVYDPDPDSYTHLTLPTTPYV